MIVAHNKRRTAWLLLIVAMLASAVTMIVMGYFDPFGWQERRADETARRVAGINLCLTRATYAARLDGLTEISRARALGASEINLRDVLVEGSSELDRAARLLRIDC